MKVEQAKTFVLESSCIDLISEESPRHAQLIKALVKLGYKPKELLTPSFYARYSSGDGQAEIEQAQLWLIEIQDEIEGF